MYQLVAKTLLIVATMHNTIYAFDVKNNHQLYWRRQFEPSCILPDSNWNNMTFCPPPDTYLDIQVEIGIISTPVVDIRTFTIYLVLRTCN